MTRNTKGISICANQSAPRSLTVSFATKFKKEVNLEAGDVISFEQIGTMIALKYFTSDNIAIPRTERKSRCRGLTTMSLIISEAKLPDLFRINLPTKYTPVKFEAVGDELLIDLSEFGLKKSFGNIANAVPANIEVTPEIKIEAPRPKGFCNITSGE